MPGVPTYSAASLVKLITDPVPPISTCLMEDERGMTRALLEVLLLHVHAQHMACICAVLAVDAVYIMLHLIC